ncbi:MAG TPA: hypothetical protein VH164_06585 [Ktedonobacteraceae bacterium]|jgi:hypothetical protein|nr:hypothetical protein [Ktedonobacteraceae bacterium]
MVSRQTQKMVVLLFMVILFAILVMWVMFASATQTVPGGVPIMWLRNVML